MTRTVPRSALRTRPPFAELFAISPETRDDIAADMRVRGYDDTEPILVWNEEADVLTVIDGHTRLDAAAVAGLEEVTIAEQYFDSELSALVTALRRQIDRRNLTPEEMVHVVPVYDQAVRKQLGGQPGKRNARMTPSTEGVIQNHKGSAVATGQALGISASTVERIRVIQADETGIAVEEVKAGVSISRAAQRALVRRRGVVFDGEPWFEAKAVGSRSASAILQAQQKIEDMINVLKAQGVAPDELIQDHRVRAEWNKALKQANALAAVIRDVLK